MVNGKYLWNVYFADHNNILFIAEHKLDKSMAFRIPRKAI